MSIRRKKFRRATVGDWILLGKLRTYKTYCSICDRPLSGGQLMYVNRKTGERAVVCQKCVGGFERVGNPAKVQIGDIIMPKKITKKEAMDFFAKQFEKVEIGNQIYRTPTIEEKRLHKDMEKAFHVSERTKRKYWKLGMI